MAGYSRDSAGIKETELMTPAQENHLQQVKDQFALAVDIKYRKGEAEHRGNLWEKEHLLDEAINEAIDLFVYLVTLKQQRKGLQ